MNPEVQPNIPFETKPSSDKSADSRSETWDSVKEKYKHMDIIGTALLQGNEDFAKRVGAFPEVQEMAASRMIKAIMKGDQPDQYDISKIKDLFNPPDEIIQKQAREQVARGVKFLEFHRILKIKSLLSAHIFQEVVSEALAKLLQQDEQSGASYDYVSRQVVGAIHILGISIETLQHQDIQQAVKERINKHLSDNDVETAVSLAKSFNLSERLLQDSNIQQAARKTAIKALVRFDEEEAIKIRDIFRIKDFQSPEIETIAQKIIAFRLKQDNIRGAMRVKQEFNISDTVAQTAIEAGIAMRLENSLQTAKVDIQKIVEAFPIPIETIDRIVKIKSFEYLQKGSVDSFRALRDDFKLNVTSSEIVERFTDLQKLCSELKQEIPGFGSQLEKSIDLLLGVFPFRDNPKALLSSIAENPFIAEAIQANPRFSSRLLVKFPEFDDISKVNIQAQFAFKKEIVARHPDMEPESLEFRKAMQEKLKAYGSNTQILEAAQARGVNTTEWLNYEETKYFKLESGDAVLAFSETIATPIRRIKETIDSFAHTIKEVLKEYKQELCTFEILLEDPKEIEARIAEMTAAKEKALAEGNDKKVLGIQKGIDNLVEKKAALKKGKLWDKLLSDVASFQRLKDDVFATHEELTKIESELSKAASEKAPSGKAIQEIKRKISGAKENLRNKLEVLERRIENFQASLSEILSPALGTERTEALVQEIQTRLAEQFDHYNTDRSTLSNLFSGRTEKQKDELESRPMSIFVWARNPDVDLYQGNYSPCCICIDSAHMGAESTIADYNTDLGVQIVNIWDETKDEPVTAAWCWLGEDENEKPALVVDNIESNTIYSAHYSELLTKELFEYLTEYAKSIGVEKIVLGKANNDLPTAGVLSKMTENEGAFSKLGGYNREGGYFLEAEGGSVKVVWEKGKETSEHRKKVEKKARKNEVVKVEYIEVEVKNLNEETLHFLHTLEERVYELEDADLIRGQALIRDILEQNGIEHSVTVWGKAKQGAESEMIGYIAAMEGETDEGDKSIYIDDIAVSPEAQRQGVGWKLLEELVRKLKIKAANENRPVLLDMHLRPNSQMFMEKHREELNALGVKLIEEALVVDYYDEGKDAVYQVYEVNLA